MSKKKSISVKTVGVNETAGIFGARDIAQIALLAAIIIVLSITPLGYIPIGAVNATTIHIPVIIAGVVLGWKKGGIAGFIFGMTSFIRATFVPNLTSFLFSPFYPGGNFWSLVIAFVPRILIGIGAYFIYKGVYFLLGKTPSPAKRSIASAVAGFGGTMINTLLVMGMAYLFFAQKYADAIGKDISLVGSAIVAVITGNGIVEALIASVISAGVCSALLVAMRFRN